ncbi:MAG: signal peptidase I [Candidatus Dormibacteria bacterium]
MSPSPAPPAGGGRKERSWLRDGLEVLVIALILYGIIWTCIQTVKVDGRSMVNTLQDGDLLIASKISYRLGSPERGDIVILTPPPYCDVDKTAPACAPGSTIKQRDFIKRIVGLPGDNVEIDGTQQPTALLVQPGGSGPWSREAEPYLPNNWITNIKCCQPDGTNSDQPHVFHVPANTYFVMGDNRNESDDSRFFGVVPKGKIEAKAILRFWPLGSFGGLGPQGTLVLWSHPVAIVWLRRRNRRLKQELSKLLAT